MQRFILAIGLALASFGAFAQAPEQNQALEARATAKLMQAERFAGSYAVTGTVDGQATQGNLILKKNRQGDGFEWNLSFRPKKTWSGSLGVDQGGSGLVGTSAVDGREQKGTLSIDGRILKLSFDGGKGFGSVEFRLVPPGGIELKTTGDIVIALSGKRQG